jgi:hypothetical protein
MQINNTLSKWQLVPLLFAQDAVAASQTAAALATTDANNSVALNVYYTMPFAGEIIGASANLDTAGTAGTLTVNPNLAGTAVTDPAISITTLAYGSDTCKRGTNAFAANARIGCKITTSATWDGTSSDLQVIVWVLLNVSGI